MLITGCLIVKNEEELLPRCLEGLLKAADRLLVADTGSIDRTREIALTAGARVIDFPWQNDFAAARNFVLDLAEGDWLIFLDADEYLSAEDAVRLKELISHINNLPQYDSCLIRIYNLNGDGSLESIHNSIRVFRNLPALRYRYSIHETLYHGARLPNPYFIADTDCKILHTGYTENKKPAKLQRNLPYLENEAFNKDGNPLAGYYLAESYLLLNRITEGIAAARAFYTSGYKPYKNSLAPALLLIKGLFFQPGSHPEIIEICQSELKNHPDHPELLKALADCYFLLKKYNEAEKFYKLSLLANQKYPAHNQEVNNFPAEAENVYYNLALIAVQKKHSAAAENYLMQALQIRRFNTRTAALYLKILNNRGYDRARISKILSGFYRPDNRQQADFIIPLLLAERLCAEFIYFVNRQPDKEKYLPATLLCLILTGEYQTAITLFEKQPELLSTEDYAYPALLLLLTNRLSVEKNAPCLTPHYRSILNQQPTTADQLLLDTLTADLQTLGQTREQINQLISAISTLVNCNS